MKSYIHYKVQLITTIGLLLLSNVVTAQDTTTVKTNTTQDTITTETKKKFYPRYYLYFGVERPNVATTLQINGERGPGLIFSLEDNLGFDSKPWLIRAEGIAKFNKHSGLLASFVQMNRKQQWIVDRDFTVFDTTFNVGATLDVYFNTTFFAVSYRYAIFSKPDWDAGLTAGIRYLQVDLGVSLVTASTSAYANSVFLPAPAPVFGVFGSAYLTKRLQVRYDFEYFNLSINGIRGAVLDNRFALEYYFIKNLGVGSAVTFLNYRLNELPLEKDFKGQVKYSFNGFNFFIAARF